MRNRVGVGLALAMALGIGMMLARVGPRAETPAGSSTTADTGGADSSALQGTAPGEAAQSPTEPARTMEAEVLAAAPRQVTVPAGTQLVLRLDETVGSDLSRVEAPVRASLAKPVVIDGETVVPAGSAVTGIVTEARRAGKVKGRAYLAMRFTSLTPKGDDETYALRTRLWAREAPGTKKKDAVKIGVPAGAGAAIGAITGGKKGAGIGAAVGGGAGTAVVLSTRGEEVRLGPGASVTVRLAQPLTVRLTT